VLRPYGLLGLLVLALYAAAIAASPGAFSEVAPWPLGGGGDSAGSVARGASLLLGLLLGWAIPGLPLALLTERRLRGGPLLSRALGLGVGYVLATGLLWAAVAGHSPGRVGRLVLLALPCAAAAVRGGSAGKEGDGEPRDRAPVAVLAASIALTALLWPRIAAEGMNGDGTEAYEHARSLDHHRIQRWDLERWEGPGRFGIPSVVPMIGYAFLAHSEMTLLGRGEVALRLPFAPMLVFCVAQAIGLARSPRGASAWAYLGGIAAVYTLWNAYYVGYEPAYTDLAEPAAVDTATAALLLAGFAELLQRSTALGAAFLLLASGIQYSAPILATLGCFVLWAFDRERGRRALRSWLSMAAAVAVAVLAVGAATGDLADWSRQLHSEYWLDFVEGERRVSAAPLAGRLLLLTGMLPLLALPRWRTLSPASRALGASLALYLVVVLAGSYKNLHYLTPFPFLLAPAALEAAGPRWRWAAVALLTAVFALTWPSTPAVHRENVALGRISCVEGLDYEAACLAGDVVYDAFARPSQGDRFGVGKHTFVRYALELGGPGPACAFRLAPVPAPGWITVAEGDLVFAARDLDRLAEWRFRPVEAPSSILFPAGPRWPPPTEWRGQFAVAEEPGAGLVLHGFRRQQPMEPGNPPSYVSLARPVGRLLLPGGGVALRTWAPAGGLSLQTRVNGEPWSDVGVAPGWSVTTIPGDARPWRTGWNVLELTAPATAPRLAIESITLGHAASP
jgi:hypothetical protein